MVITTVNHTYKYEAEKLCRIFFPNEPFDFSSERYGGTDDCVNTQLTDAENGFVDISADVTYKGKKQNAFRTVSSSDESFEKSCERALAYCIYDVLKSVTGYTPPWGILTGVRPAKLMSSYCNTMDGDAAKSYFREKLLVSPEKAELAYEVAKKESAITSLSKPDSFSLYVSVPFCPTRCSYCSFVSHSNAAAKKLIPEYVDLLCREIELTGKIAFKLGLRLESVYYGGGTPTVLEAEQLERVMQAVSQSFDLSKIREYTVEAGRPDSITRDKLNVIKNNGADRISINPQTFDDEILRIIGRQHTSRQTLDAFHMAREAGMNNINMDLIAGLPTDTEQGFRRTLDICLEENPESITVHTLALKRSSTLVTEEKADVNAASISEMLDSVKQKLYPAGYKPYYMYRQSKTAGNMENVGWAKDGYESCYNIFMMEESHTVLGVGGAAVTKLKRQGSNDIERIFNFKYPYEYISKFDELMKRKDYIAEFYGK